MVDQKKALLRFSGMLKCQTVVGRDEEFHKFYNLLKENYPLVHTFCEYERIGNKGLIYRLKGRNSNESVVFLSHYDVVPADKGEWKHPPFSGKVAEGKIWGRGALDTKCTLCAILESVEATIAKGHVPRNDVYLCFGGDEETTGEGAKGIVRELNRRRVTPYLVLDEGGAVVHGSILGVGGPLALVGIAEKGYMDLEFVAKSKGGHTSIPRQGLNPMTTMAKVIVRMHQNPFPIELSPPVRAMLKEIAKHRNAAYRFLLSNDGIMKFFIKNIWMQAAPILRALFQTTCSVTRIEGSNANNVIPERVRAVGNVRILNGNTMPSTIKKIKGILSDLDVEIHLLRGRNPSKVSRTDGKGWDVLAEAITKTWGRVAIVPYVLLAASDSYAYQDVSPYVYRFSPIRLRKEDKDAIHGTNECIRLKDFFRMIDFYTDLLNNV